MWPSPVALEPVAAPRPPRAVVIDDELPLLRIYRRILGRFFDVAVASSSEAGLALLVEGGDSVDVVLCDLLMPGMTGLDLHAALRARDPRLADRVVFVTGCADGPRARAYLASLPNPVLEKPFTERDLLEVIDRVVLRASPEPDNASAAA